MDTNNNHYDAHRRYGSGWRNLAYNLAEKYSFVSPGLVTLSSPQLGLLNGLLVRDPDGHVDGVDRKMRRVASSDRIESLAALSLADLSMEYLSWMPDPSLFP